MTMSRSHFAKGEVLDRSHLEYLISDVKNFILHMTEVGLFVTQHLLQ